MPRQLSKRKPKRRTMRGGDGDIYEVLSNASQNIAQYDTMVASRYQEIRRNGSEFQPSDIGNIFVLLDRTILQYNECVDILMNNSQDRRVVDLYNDMYTKTVSFIQAVNEFMKFVFIEVCIEAINFYLKQNDVQHVQLYYKLINDTSQYIQLEYRTKTEKKFKNTRLQSIFDHFYEGLSIILEALNDKNKLNQYIREIEQKSTTTQGIDYVLYSNNLRALYDTFAQYIKTTKNPHIIKTTEDEMRMMTERLAQLAAYTTNKPASASRRSSSSKKYKFKDSASTGAYSMKYGEDAVDDYTKVLRSMKVSELKELIIRHALMTETELAAGVDKSELIRLLRIYNANQQKEREKSLSPSERLRIELNRLSIRELKERVPKWRELGLNEKYQFVEYLVEASEKKPSSTEERQRRELSLERKEQELRKQSQDRKEAELQRRRKEESKEQKLKERLREVQEREEEEIKRQRAKYAAEEDPIIQGAKSIFDLNTLITYLNRHMEYITGNKDAIAIEKNTKKQLIRIQQRVHPDKCQTDPIHNARCTEITSIIGQKTF